MRTTMSLLLVLSIFVSLPTDSRAEFVASPKLACAAPAILHKRLDISDRRYAKEEACADQIADEPSMWFWDSHERACYPSFLNYCLNKARYGYRIERSVDAVLEKTQRVNCEGAQSRLSEVSSLQLNHTRFSELGIVREFRQLKTLNIARTLVGDLRPLRAWTSLEGLYANGSQVVSLEGVSALRSLKWLNIAETGVSDLSPLSRLQNLESINASFTSIEVLSPLSQLRGLRFLDIAGVAVRDIEALAHLHRLEECNIEGCPISDISALLGLRSLRRVWLNNTDVAESPNLQELEASSTVQLMGEPNPMY